LCISRFKPKENIKIIGVIIIKNLIKCTINKFLTIIVKYFKMKSIIFVKGNIQICR